MAISFVGGKPGAGKTLYSVGLIVRELLTSDRLVVTNVPLKVDRLNEYLQEQAPEKSVPLVGPNSRLVILDDNEEARELYRLYSKRYYEETNQEQREVIYFEYESQIKKQGVSEEVREFWKYREKPGRRFDDDTGTLFVLDELHIHFNARKWMQTGEACLHYLSQHRKLSDDVICITQALGNVDKQFRSVAEDFTMIVNESKRRLGPFKGRNRFVRASYYKEPQGNRDQPFERVDFQLDAKGVASCYDTAAGVGVHGNKADTTKKTKGIPIMVMLPVAVVLVAVVAGIIPYAMGKLAGSYMEGPETEGGRNGGIDVVSHPVRSLPSHIQEPPQDVAGRQKGFELPLPPTPVKEVVENPLYVTGITILNRANGVGRYSIRLSDGRTINETDSVVAAITRNRVKFKSGQELWIGPPVGNGPAREEESGTGPGIPSPELLPQLPMSVNL